MSGRQNLFGIDLSRRSFLSGAAGLARISLFDRLTNGHELSEATQTKTIDYASVIARFKERLPGLMIQYKIPGVAMALVDSDKVVWAEGLGYTNRSQKVKVTDETLFSLQSISKTYTALGTLMACIAAEDTDTQRTKGGFRNTRSARSSLRIKAGTHWLRHWQIAPWN